MSCREHVCVECNHAVFDNNRMSPECECCGGRMQSFSDEEPDKDDEDLDALL